MTYCTRSSWICIPQNKYSVYSAEFRGGGSKRKAPTIRHYSTNFCAFSKLPVIWHYMISEAQLYSKNIERVGMRWFRNRPDVTLMFTSWCYLMFLGPFHKDANYECFAERIQRVGNGLKKKDEKMSSQCILFVATVSLLMTFKPPLQALREGSIAILQTILGNFYFKNMKQNLLVPKT